MEIISCDRCHAEIQESMPYYHHQRSLFNGCTVCIRELENYNPELMKQWRLIQKNPTENYECCQECG